MILKGHSVLCKECTRDWLSWIGETSGEPPLDMQVRDESDSLQYPQEPSVVTSDPCSPIHHPDLFCTLTEHPP